MQGLIGSKKLSRKIKNRYEVVTSIVIIRRQDGTVGCTQL